LLEADALRWTACEILQSSAHKTAIAARVVRDGEKVRLRSIARLGASRKDQHGHRAFGARKVFDSSAHGLG
jgi:hypothetical protein